MQRRGVLYGRHAFCFAVYLGLVAIEEAGDEEQEGEHEREFCVRLGVETQLGESVPKPYDTPDEPDPG